MIFFAGIDLNSKMEIRKAVRDRPHPCKKQIRKDGPPKGFFRN
jgi:hypothetical protein